MNDENQHAENSDSVDVDRAETSSVQPQTEADDLSGPDYRAHVRPKPRPLSRVTLYDRGQQVYLKRARGLQGPYIVRKVNSDGTYQLESESGKLFQDGAKERDLQPL